MARVIWSDRALARLEEIADGIARDAPGAAAGLIRRIFHAAEQLESFPRSGRVVPDFDDRALRELIVGNYRVL
jgi:toxin ParE1/3/4